jgi:DNA polymerase III subunit epsilon
MSYKNRRVAFFDTETTGLDPDKHDIIEFAVTYLDGETVSHRVKPMNIEDADPRALQVNGYTEAAWVDAMAPGEAARLIPNLLNYCVVVGHNIQYDLGMVRGLFRKVEMAEPRFFGFPAVDTMGLACFLLTPHGLNRLGLKDVCEFLGIDPEDQVHRAAAGAQKCGEVYKRLLAATESVPSLVLGAGD